MKEKQRERDSRLKEKEALKTEKDKQMQKVAAEKQRKAAMPKKPKSAFTYFYLENFSSVYAQNKDVVATVRAISDKFKKLSAEDRVVS
jgi:hypothetical protein